MSGSENIVYILLLLTISKSHLQKLPIKPIIEDSTNVWHSAKATMKPAHGHFTKFIENPSMRKTDPRTYDAVVLALLSLTGGTGRILCSRHGNRPSLSKQFAARAEKKLLNKS